MLIKIPRQGKKEKENPNLLGGPVFCSWWQLPILSGPLSGSNCPTPWFRPLSPLSHYFSPITLFTTTTSTIMVFFVWDSTVCVLCIVCTFYVYAHIKLEHVNSIQCKYIPFMFYVPTCYFSKPQKILIDHTQIYPLFSHFIGVQCTLHIL